MIKKKQTIVKVTLNKQLMVQHLIVKKKVEPTLAAEIIDFLGELQRETLIADGRVVWKNIGTLCMKVAPAKTITMFGGAEKRVRTRYKLKFVQSKNYNVSRSPLKGASVEEELAVLSKIKFSGDGK